MNPTFEVLMGWETELYHYTAMALVRAEADWLAVIDAEARVRMVFRLKEQHMVNVVRTRRLTPEEAWTLGLRKGPIWARISKAELAALGTGLTGFQD